MKLIKITILRYSCKLNALFMHTTVFYKRISNMYRATVVLKIMNYKEIISEFCKLGRPISSLKQAQVDNNREQVD